MGKSMKKIVFAALLLVFTFSFAEQTYAEVVGPTVGAEDSNAEYIKSATKNKGLSSCSCPSITCGPLTTPSCSTSCSSPEYASCGCAYCLHQPIFENPWRIPAYRGCGCRGSH